jgi:MFS family permease
MLTNGSGGISTIPLWRTYAVVIALTLLFICNTASIQSMNVAVGFVAADLKFEHAQVQWIQSAYELSSGCLLLLYVPLSDQFQARYIALFGGGFFCIWVCVVIGSCFDTLLIYQAIACAVAQSPMQFIIFRALEGAGICAVVPAGFAILGQMLPVTAGKNTRRNILIASFAAGAPLGSAMGTVFGGLPTQYSAIGWRGIYAVMAGISGAGTILAAVTLPPSQTRQVKGGVE